MQFSKGGDEYFWGGVIDEGERMPYAAGSGFDTATSVRDNQVSPLLLSSQGRYFWADGDLAVRFDGATVHLDEERSIIHSGGTGDTLRSAFLEASAKYFPVVGGAPPEAMFTAPQYNTWIELVYDQTQDRILEYARGLIANGYPAGVLMIDDNWQEDYGVWQFHPARFSDPKAMVTELHELGFIVMLWVCPFLSADSATFRELEPRGYLLRDEHGGTAVRRWWNGLSAVLDLTNPQTIEWFHARLRSLQESFDVDGFKFDTGDQRFYRAGDLSYSSTDPNGHCASYSAFGLSYPFNEFRSGWQGGGRPLAQRLTDALPIWGNEGFASLIPRGLAQGLNGYPFNCPDMVGGGMASRFEEEGFRLDEELFVRWTQCSALFPMMQFSLAPWRVLSPDNAALCIDAVQLRQRFVPEILELVRHAADTGEPIIRHLEYVFPHQGYHMVIDQFLLGDDILVAPVTEQGARTRRVVFPPGTWNGDDGSTVLGPTVEVVDAPLDRLPHYRRGA